MFCFLNLIFMKKKVASISFIALFITAIIANNILSLSSTDSSIELNSIMNIKEVSAESTSYKGPLCSNQSGTYYCCKGSSGSCSAGAECPSCQ